MQDVLQQPLEASFTMEAGGVDGWETNVVMPITLVFDVEVPGTYSVELTVDGAAGASMPLRFIPPG